MATCPKCGTHYASNVRICTHDGTVLNDEPVNDSKVGKLLDGKYRLDSYLSQGGMGAVYKATHVMLDKTVVVKLIKPELVTSAEVVRRFQREARAASNLNHPNIVAVYDLGQTDDGTLYIAMEFIDGPSLKDVIRKTGPMPVPRIVAILRQVAAALAQAHGHNIIHRDLKPHNVMLAKGPSGQEIAKLLDFGIAKTFEDGSTQLTQTGFAIGTPQYMAPEQAAGKEVTAQSDLYSLGAMLYEMLIGEVPFDAPTTAAILIKQLTEQPLPPSRRKPELNVSPALEAIALRCLDKEPSRRYESAAAFAEALADVDTGAATVLNQPASAPTRIFAPPEAASPAIPSRTATTAAPPIPSAPLAPTHSVPTATAAAAPPAPPTAGAPAPAVAVGAPPIAAAPPSDGTRPTVPGSAMPAAALPPAPAASSSRTGLWITLGAAAVLVLAVAASQLGLLPGEGKESTSTQAAQSAPPQASPASADAPAAAAPSAAATPAPSTPTASNSVATPPAASPLAEAPAPSPAAAPASASAGSGSTAAASPRPAPAPASAAAPAPVSPAAGVAIAAATAAAAAKNLAAGLPANANPGNRPAASEPAAAPASAPSAAPAPAAPAARAAQPARPENPTVFLRCEGFPAICNALRASLLEQFQKQDIQPVREPSRAAIVLTTNVEVVQERVSRDFGTPMQTRTYSVDVSGETHDGAPVSMPPTKTFSFDAQFGRERLEENVRVLASDVTDKIKAFWKK